jgi:hypothetical protein
MFGAVWTAVPGGSRLLRGAVLGLTVSGLVACGSTAPAPAENSGTDQSASPSAAPSSAAAAAKPAHPLRGTDWAKATTFRCPVADQRVIVVKVVDGDITGDGVADSVVSLTCSTQTSSNPVRVEAFDGTSAPAHPKSLGILISETDPMYVEEADVTIAPGKVTVAGGAVGQDAPLAAGPQVKFTQAFTYRAGTLHPGPRHTG